MIQPITATVPFDLILPVGLEFPSPNGKTPAVPEVAVHEDDQPRSREDKIRFAR